MKNKTIKRMRYLLSFIYRNSYIPNFEHPKSYNEKINHRKRYCRNKLFSVCSDKIEVKEYVSKLISKEFIIPTIESGNKLTANVIQRSLKNRNSVFVKANHNSGPVYKINTDTPTSEIDTICEDINRQLTLDYGSSSGEPWYSEIPPKFLVEPDIGVEAEEVLDYKFHIFKQNSGEQQVLLHVDFDRETNHNRSFFDEELNWLPFSTFVPSLKTKISQPKNYKVMLDIAKKLAEPFSYARVDFYNIDGAIYFGELTFAPGSGHSKFSDKSYDFWLGNLWIEDCRY
ncbi:ATP-grasp fold amidoligase family protein [Vibrio lentus]